MFKLGMTMDKIIPSLYIGHDIKDQNQLELYKITHVISVIDNYKKNQSNIHYLFISLADQMNQNLNQYFSQSNDFIHEARLNGGKVMIQYVGSKSIILAGIYLLSITSLDALSAFNALKCVRGERPIINQNDGFLKQLQQFEGIQLKEERRRLFKKFNGQVFRPNDEVEARKLVKLFERQNQTSNNNFLNFTQNLSTATKHSRSNWDRSKKLIKKSEIKEKSKDQSKDQLNKIKSKQVTIGQANLSPSKIIISSPTNSTNKIQLCKITNLVRSNSGMYLTSNKVSTSPTGGVRRKLMNPTSILKKQMSIDSLTTQTANLNLNSQKQTKSPTSKQSLNLPQSINRNASAPATTGRSNPELNK